MNNLELLAEALEYMEQHLSEDIRTEDIAENCYCSKSTLEKLFRCVNHISVRDYMVRRRMTKAAKRLVECPQESVLEVALNSGYSSHEAFTRAFVQVWNCTPSGYREKGRTFGLFPRLNTPLESGDEYIMQRRHFDISELYDLFKTRSECYFVCCDIKTLIPINEISMKAGDLAILETMRRMEEAAGEEDIVFRIGGDEFAMLTNSSEESYAQQIAQKILSHNKECFDFEGRQIPLSVYAGVVKPVKKNLRYSELFTDLQSALHDVKLDTQE